MHEAYEGSLQESSEKQETRSVEQVFVVGHIVAYYGFKLKPIQTSQFIWIRKLHLLCRSLNESAAIDQIGPIQSVFDSKIVIKAFLKTAASIKDLFS